MSCISLHVGVTDSCNSTAAVTAGITTESIAVDLNTPTAAETRRVCTDVHTRVSGTTDPRQSTFMPMNVSSTENMAPKVEKTTDTNAITIFPTLTLLATTVISTELSKTPLVPGIYVYPTRTTSDAC